MPPASDQVATLYARSRAAYAAGDLPTAIAALESAASIPPPHVEILNNLGLLLSQSGRLTDAIDALTRATSTDPTRPEPHANLGNALRAAGDLTRALASYQASLSLDPNNVLTLNNLAATLFDTGDLDQSLSLARRAISLRPDLPTLHSNLLYALHFHPASTPQSLLDEHRAYAARHAPRISPLPHPPNRKLRIGYVSPDFREHVIARFLLPILTHHDRTRFETFCYSNLTLPPDATTQRIRESCDHWRPIATLTDPQAAHRIRRDGIDILVDLSMHMSNHRLSLFALKPAPVQATYLAYPSTTGLPAIDYRLTDPHLDPPGTDPHYTERSLRLETYWCYHPPFPLPAPTPLPALTAGHITFGSLNNFRKVSPATLETWAQLLSRVPHSHLHLHTPHGPHRPRILSLFASHNIPPTRLKFLDPTPLQDYFHLYDAIDIALDPFPYAGGTTTCDAAYMGVPTITLPGPTAVSRGGLSILTTLSLPDLIAQSPPNYLRIATTLANDLPRLTHLRTTLRPRMESSPLMNAPRFTRHLESAYTQMWTATPRI